jgi:hypothetical protein
MTAIEFLDDPAGYRPGACNIGPAEIARRRRAGITGLSVTAALAAGMVLLDAAPVVRLAIAAPLFFGLLGVVQARSRFCVGFAMAGIRNLGALGDQSRVDDTEARAADRRRAMVITGAVGAGSVLIAVAFALLPL